MVKMTALYVCKRCSKRFTEETDVSQEEIDKVKPDLTWGLVWSVSTPVHRCYDGVIGVIYPRSFYFNEDEIKESSDV